MSPVRDQALGEWRVDVDGVVHRYRRGGAVAFEAQAGERGGERSSDICAPRARGRAHGPTPKTMAELRKAAHAALALARELETTSKTAVEAASGRGMERLAADDERLAPAAASARTASPTAQT